MISSLLFTNEITPSYEAVFSKPCLQVSLLWLHYCICLMVLLESSQVMGDTNIRVIIRVSQSRAIHMSSFERSYEV